MAGVAYLPGSLAAWYETTLLIGRLPAGQVTLVNAPVAVLAGTSLTHFLPALGVAVAASALALTIAAARLRGREI